MKLNLSCADFTFPLLTHEQSLRLIAMLGFQGVDIGLFEDRAHLWPSREFADVRTNAAELKKKLDDVGLVASDIFLQASAEFEPLAINHPDADRRQKARDWFDCALEYAAICGAPHVTILPGVVFDDPRASLDRCVEELSWRIERANAAGIAMGIEAHHGSIVPEPARVLALLERTPDLKLTLDYTHFVCNGIDESQVEPLLAHANHFHCRGGRPGRMQASFKNNTIDYQRIVERLNALQYAGYICIEYVWIDWQGCNETDNVSETILFRDALKQWAGRS